MPGNVQSCFSVGSFCEVNSTLILTDEETKAQSTSVILVTTKQEAELGCKPSLSSDYCPILLAVRVYGTFETLGACILPSDLGHCFLDCAK